MTTPTPTPSTNPLVRFWAAEDAPSEKARKAFRICLVNGLASFPALPQYLYQAIQTGAWQLFVLVADVFMLALLSLIAAALCRRGRVEAGIGLLIGSIFFVCLNGAITLAGLGFPESLIVFVAASTIAMQTLPSREASRAVLITIPFCIAMALLDFARLPFQYPIPAVLPFLQVTGGVMVVLFIFTTVFKLTARPQPGAGGENQIK